MQSSGYSDGGSSLALPGMTPVVKRLLIALGAIWLATVLISLVDDSWIYSVRLGVDSGSGGDLRADSHASGLFAWFGATPAVWFDGFPWIYPWQILTYGFLHTVDSPFHLLFNLLAIYFFGTMVEGAVGSRRFVQFFLAAIAVGGITTLLLKPLISGTGPTVGVSAAVYAILCCAAVMSPRSTVLLFFFPLPLAWLAIGLVGIDFFFLVQQLAGRANSFTDHTAHLAGAGFGFLAARRHWVWQDWGAVVQQQVAAKQAKDRASDEAKLDELLVKIQKNGINSLSPREREFLKRMSGRG